MGTFSHMGDAVMKIMQKTDAIIFVIIFFLAGIFVGYVGDRVFAKDCFTKEFMVKVQPMSWQTYPERYHCAPYPHPPGPAEWHAGRASQ